MSTSIQRLSLFCLLSLGLMACSNDASKGTPATAQQTPPAIPVTVLEARPQRMPAQIEVVGQTEGFKEIEVRARVNGLLTKQIYQEGSVVKAGQPLFQIDRAPFEITAAQARAALTEAKARSMQSTRELERLKDLLVKQAVSRKEVDDAQTHQQLMQAALEQAQASVKQAELNLSYTIVTAPASGLSGRANHTEGNLITGGTDSLLTTIVQTHPMRARFSVSENDIARLGEGRLDSTTLNKVELILPNGTVYQRAGKIDFLASQIDPALGTRSLRAEFANPEQQLLPGQFVRVRLLTRAEREVFLVPQVAVLQNDKGYNVFVVDSNQNATLRPVEVGEWSGKNWVITKGLNAGDKVVVDNLIKLKPGAPVVPKSETPKPAASAAAASTASLPAPSSQAVHASRPAAHS